MLSTGARHQGPQRHPHASKRKSRRFLLFPLFLQRDLFSLVERIDFVAIGLLSLLFFRLLAR